MNTHNRKESSWVLERGGTHHISTTFPLNFIKYTCIFKTFSTFGVFEILFRKVNYHLVGSLVVNNRFKEGKKNSRNTYL